MADKKVKGIEIITDLKVKDLRNGFENPRKIDKKGVAKLKKSIDNYGDFSSFVIDEKNNIISGTQRARQLMEIDPNTPVLCKKLIGFRVVTDVANPQKNDQYEWFNNIYLEDD